MITQKDIEGLFQAVNDMAELRSENKALKKENKFYKQLLTKQLNLHVVSASVCPDCGDKLLTDYTGDLFCVSDDCEYTKRAK